MLIGGVILGAGMVLDLALTDYRNGPGPIRFTVDRVVATCRADNADWVVLDGTEHPGPASAWRSRRVAVLISSLRRCLVLS